MTDGHADPTSAHDDPREPELVRVAERIVAALAQQRVPARLLGGVAVALRCPVARGSGPLAREFSDLDFAARRAARKQLKEVLGAQGFDPVVRFNAANGDTRLLFETAQGLHADVFVDTFSMCHTLPLKKRIEADAATLPLADLALTKLQVAEVNRKDVSDVAAILHDHPLTQDDAGVNLPYVVDVLAGDWGWWRTVGQNLEVVQAMLPELGLEPHGRERVAERLRELREAIERAPKSLRWKARARIGERRPWREDPEEATRPAM